MGGIAAVAVVAFLFAASAGEARAAAPTFAAPAFYPTGKQPTTVAIADLNGDGIPDLVAGDQGRSVTDWTQLPPVFGFDPGDVQVRLGNGDGTFGAPTSYTLSTLAPTTSVAVGDVTGDGIPDIVATLTWEDQVVVLPGAGDGTFGAPIVTPLGEPSPSQVVLSDLNGDGRLDVVVSVYAGVLTYLGTGSGHFGSGWFYNLWPDQPSIEVGDATGDGIPDVLVSRSTPSYTNGSVGLMRGNGDGTFAAPATVIAHDCPYDYAIADLNGDGIADLAVTNSCSGDVSVHLGTGGGSFAPAVLYQTGHGQVSGTGAIVATDLNGDGIPDLAVTEAGNGGSFTGDLAVFIGNGDGTFQAVRDFAAGAPTFDLAAGDLNGDGRPDLVAAADTTDRLEVLLNTTVPPDTTPPSIVPTVTGTLGDNGWYTSDIHVTWAVADPESAVSSTSGCGPADVTADTDVAGVTVTCTATSLGGTASQSVTVKRDATAPTGVVTTLDSGPAASGWYTGPVGWTTAGSDAGSGIAACTTGTYSGPDGAAASVAGSCTDLAGNTTAAGPVSFRYDATPPTDVVTTLDRGPDANGWYDAPVGWTTSGSDATSGIASCTSGTYGGPDAAAATIAGSCTDAAGNTAAAAPVTIGYDATPPATTATPDRAAGPGGWYTSAVTVTLAAVDALSGVATTEYSLDGGPWTPYTAPLAVAGDGSHTLAYRSTDLAGNVESAQSLTIGIDATPPEAYLAFDPVSKDVAVYGRDALSGVPGGPIAPSDSSHGTRTYVVADRAGNTLTLVVRVEREGHELRASIVSLSYDGGAASAAGANGLSVEWSAARDGSLRELQQSATVGRERTRSTVSAHYDAKSGRTTFGGESESRHGSQSVAGLVLLHLATAAGALSIER